MASASKISLLVDSSTCPPRTPGTLGILDAGAPDAPRLGVFGDTPGPLGHCDPAEPFFFQRSHFAFSAERRTRLTLPGSVIPYLPGRAIDAEASAKAILANQGFQSEFRTLLAKLVTDMFATYQLVLAIVPQGGYRSFAQQAALPATSTKAGPGESNHNFGRGADLGFKDLNWIKHDGSLIKDDPWLTKMHREAAVFWAARNALTALSPSNLAGDVVHLQAYSDDDVSMRHSLAALLNLVGKTKWQTAPGGKYKSNLGAGLQYYEVGSAKAIWKGEATVTKAMLVAWRSSTAKQPATPAAKPPTEAIVADADVKAMQLLLQQDWALAETNRDQWQPIS